MSRKGEDGSFFNGIGIFSFWKKSRRRQEGDYREMSSGRSDSTNGYNDEAIDYTSPIPASYVPSPDSEEIVRLDAMSSGFTSRIVGKVKELSVGQFPSVHLSPKPRKCHIKIKEKRVGQSRVNILPPGSSTLGLSEGHSSNSMKSVLQVLKEFSRKRPLQDGYEKVENLVKRPKPTRHNLYLSQLETATALLPVAESLMNGKRNREEIPMELIHKRQKRAHLNTSRNNEILSSLSSSVDIVPPHLLSQKKKFHKTYSSKQLGSSEKHKKREGDRPEADNEGISPKSKQDDEAEPPKKSSSPLDSKAEKKSQEVQTNPILVYSPPPKRAPSEPLEKVVTRPMANALLKSAMSKFIATGQSELAPVKKDPPPVLPSLVSLPKPAASVPATTSIVIPPVISTPAQTTMSAPATTAIMTFSSPVVSSSTTTPSLGFNFGSPPITSKAAALPATPIALPTTPLTTKTTQASQQFNISAVETPKKSDVVDSPKPVGTFNFVSAPSTSTPITSSVASPTSQAQPTFSFISPSTAPSTTSAPSSSLFTFPPVTTTPKETEKAPTTGFKLPSGVLNFNFTKPPAELPKTTEVKATGELFSFGKPSVPAVTTSAITASTATPSPSKPILFGSTTTTTSSLSLGFSAPTPVTASAPLVPATTAAVTTSVFQFGSSQATPSTLFNPTPVTTVPSTTENKTFGSGSSIFGNILTATSATASSVATTVCSGFALGSGSSIFSNAGSDASPALPAATTSAPPSGGIFGQSKLFGDSTAPATTTSTGLFSTPTKSAFTFGAGTTTPATQPSGIFGTPAKTEAKPAAPTPFTFGASTTPLTTSSGGFTFNPPTTKPATTEPPKMFSLNASFSFTNANQPTTQSGGIFGAKPPAFGAASGTQPTFGSGSGGFSSAAQTTPAAQTRFGTDTAKPVFGSTENKPVFGSGTGSTVFGATTQTPPTFGATSPPAFSVAGSTQFGASQATTPLFGSGSQQNGFLSAVGARSQPNPPAFGSLGQGFGSTQPTTAPSLSSGFGSGAEPPSFGSSENKPFVFGASTGNEAPKTFMFNAPQQNPNPGVFQFGQNASTSSAPFQFNAQTPAAGGPMFCIGSGGSASAQRTKLTRKKKT